MATEESERSGVGVSAQTADPGTDDTPTRFSLDDFRLRLDSPLFHRDPGMATAEPLPQLRELTWEKVVHQHPSQQAPIEEHDHAPAVEEFRSQFVPAPSLPSLPLLARSAEPAAEPAPGPEPEQEPESMSVVDLSMLEIIAPPVSQPRPYMPAITPRSTPTITPPSTPAVEAELNRLAYLPDLEETAGPVEVPIIKTADQPIVVAQYVPTLSQSDMYVARSSPVAVAPRRNYMELAAAMAPQPRRQQKGHPLRRLFATVVLLGLVGGGLFAAKYYFLDQRWSGDVKPLAAEVETARGLTFDHAVDVATVPSAEYSLKLVKAGVGLDTSNAGSLAGEWRALGLLSGALDPATLGLAGLADAPAFYDPGAEKIYVVDGLPTDLRRFALHRALAMALLDQEYDWSGRTAHSSPAVARGTRALYDADALAVANSLLDSGSRVSVLTQQQALYTAFQIPASAVPFATAVSARSGLALRPYFDGAPTDARDSVERSALVTDGQVLDMRRLLSGRAESTSADAQGMLFWYHVLASRVDNDTAWRAALAWQDDSLSVVQGPSGTCVTALLSVDPGQADSATAAFQAWAAAAPAQSGTQVSASPGVPGQLTVTACDPTDQVPTNDGRVRLSLGGAALRSEQFRQLQLAFPQLSQQQLACATFTGDAVSPADERSLIDPVEGWGVLATHPAPDPNAAGCAPA